MRFVGEAADLVKEDVVKGIRVDLYASPLGEVVRDPPCSRQTLDQVPLRLERGVERPEVAGPNRGVARREREGRAVRGLASERARLVRRGGQPVGKIAHKVASLRQARHGELERRVLPLETRAAATLGLARGAEGGGVVDSDATARLEDGVERGEEVVDPDGGWIGEVRDGRTLAFRVERVGDGELLAGRESAAEGLLPCTMRDVDAGGDEVDGRADLEVSVDAVKVRDEVRIRREGEALIWWQERKESEKVRMQG